MPRGLLIDMNDGSPVMEITAGLRCPSLSADTEGVGGTNILSVRKTPGSKMIMLPRKVAIGFYHDLTSLIPTILMLDGFTDNNDGTVTYNWWSSDRRYPGEVNSAIFAEILPPSQGGNRGLLISDSTDFTAISSDTQFIGCIWSGYFTVNGTTTLPAYGIPFGCWDAPGISIALLGNKLMAYRVGDFYGDSPASVTIRLAIFARKEPVPGKGLNFVNKEGKVTFSTTSKPFIFSNEFWIPSSGNKNISGKMVLICSTGFRSSNAGGWCNMKTKGIVMAGGVVSSASNKTEFSWTDQYSIIQDRNANLQLPLIPAMY